MTSYRYPDTHAERVAWLDRGTPAPWTTYTADAPDAYRDGLRAGFRNHVGMGPHEKRPAPIPGPGATQHGRTNRNDI